jgi:hypothetical protein
MRVDIEALFEGQVRVDNSGSINTSTEIPFWTRLAATAPLPNCSSTCRRASGVRYTCRNDGCSTYVTSIRIWSGDGGGGKLLFSLVRPRKAVVPGFAIVERSASACCCTRAWGDLGM